MIYQPIFTHMCNTYLMYSCTELLSSRAGLQPAQLIVQVTDVSTCLCVTNVFHIAAPPTVFLWFSQNLANMIYVPKCKKNCGTDFLKF